jgi:hypothetical protein
MEKYRDKVKHTLLYFCSWLDIKSPPSFFYDQAEIFNDEFNAILVVFKEYKAVFWNLFKKKIGIHSNWNKEYAVSMVEIQIPNYSFLPKLINEKIKNQAVKFLNADLALIEIKPTLIHAQSVFDAGIWAYKYYFHYKTLNLLN